jgi:hypothetical protein
MFSNFPQQNIGAPYIQIAKLLRILKKYSQYIPKILLCFQYLLVHYNVTGYLWLGLFNITPTAFYITVEM